MRGSTLLIALFMLLTHDVKSIRLVELRVPAHAVVGGEALLGCQFDMEGDILYSVKWYKDDREFYRYVPRNRVPVNHFSMKGVTVDVSRSSSNVVTLMDLQRESAGLYRCEVSGEAPHFAMAAAENYIHMQVLPQKGPRITGLKNHYQYGDRLEVNCTSSGSMPEAELKWLVNNRAAPRDHIRGPWHSDWNDPPNTFETSLQLRFTVMPKHFKSGVMELKCQATIAPLYQQETVQTIMKTELPEPDTVEQTSSTDEVKNRMSQTFQETIQTLHEELRTLPPSGSDTNGHTTWSGTSLAIILHTLALHIFINVIM